MPLIHRLAFQTHPITPFRLSPFATRHPFPQPGQPSIYPCYFKNPIRIMATSTPPQQQIQILYKYTACDVADALLKIKVPNAGFLPDLTRFSPPATSSSNQITIAPASTVFFAPKSDSDASRYPSANIPPGKHWADLTEPDTIVVLTQPEGQKCAVLGGIMALRIKVRNAKGIVVSGRIRDVDELGSTGLPVCIFLHPQFAATRTATTRSTRRNSSNFCLLCLSKGVACLFLRFHLYSSAISASLL